MKLSALLNVIFTSCLVSADTEPNKLFEDLEATNYAGDVHLLQWTTNQTYNIELLLVEQKHDAWDNPTETLLEDELMEAGDQSYNWTVPEVDGIFALYLHGVSPDDSSIHYTNQSYWFQIKDPGHEESKLSGGAIAGIVVGTVGAGVTLVSLIIIGLIMWRRAYQSRCHNCETAHQRLAENPSERQSFDSMEKAKAKAELDSQEVVELRSPH